MTERYTAEQLDYLREHYPTLSRVELTEKFNQAFGLDKTVRQIVSTLKNHKIRSGRSGFFLPGGVSWNKGSKGVMQTNSGSFQKGQIPPNVRGIGEERTDKKDGYVWVKVAEINPYTGAPTRFRQKHHVVWEAHRGVIPKSHVIMFLDGDRTNCAIENLRCVNRGVLQYLNKSGLCKATGEARKSAILTAEVATKIHERAKA